MRLAFLAVPVYEKGQGKYSVVGELAKSTNDIKVPFSTIADAVYTLLQCIMKPMETVDLKKCISLTD